MADQTPNPPARSWDMGDPEPDDVTRVRDYTDEFATPDEQDSPIWGRVSGGFSGRASWKGYKNGAKTYLEWPELVRRWGPVQEDR